VNYNPTGVAVYNNNTLRCGAFTVLQRALKDLQINRLMLDEKSSINPR
jgi:hypothetical protein